LIAVAHLVLGLLLTSPAVPECVTVDGGFPKTASHNLEVTVQRDGKPVADASLSVFGYRGQLLQLIFRRTTDKKGFVALKDLDPGFYEISATSTEDDELAVMQVAVAVESTQPAASFTMNLTGMSHYAAALKMPVTEHVRQFTGTITDPSGAGIPSASIFIYPDGNWNSSTEKVIHTDDQGRFSAKLPPGIYRALVSGIAFRSRFLVFEIRPDAENKEVNVQLEIGRC
jgi:Carboxypeptidase regulatory-like domain